MEERGFGLPGYGIQHDPGALGANRTTDTRLAKVTSK